MKKSALDVLMTGKTKKRRLSTNLVDCPAGCGARIIAGERLNTHLDQCLGLTKEKAPQQTGSIVLCPAKGSAKKSRVDCPSCQQSFPASVINLHLDVCLRPSNTTNKKEPSQRQPNVDHDDKIGKKLKDPPQNKSPIVSQEVETPDALVTSHAQANDQHGDESTVSTNKDSGESPPAAENPLFSQMMMNAKRVFSVPKQAVPISQLFHLRSDGSLTLLLQSDSFENEALTRCWSSIITLRDQSTPRDGDEEASRVTFNVNVSCSLPSQATSPKKWVRRHSRFSIPVLKSLLQKSIRRRRPLPSVRIAMELADKALGELLRRFPIIILEDSTLHPQFDYVVLLMMAHSKGYQIPTPMMIRLFRIVFEVASCPRTDPIDDASSALESEEPTLRSLHANSNTFRSSRSEVLSWSMLVRASYGGMKGDVRMLRQYAHVWMKRCSVGERALELPDLRVPCDSWHDVPHILHQHAHQQSMQKVTDLCTSGLERLSIDDLCPEAIDFHCSSVVEHVLSDPEVCGVFRDLLVLSKTTEGLEPVVKKCIWTFSAGVNYRYPLSAKSPQTKDDEFGAIWRDLLAPRVLAFQRKYIGDRVV